MHSCNVQNNMYTGAKEALLSIAFICLYTDAEAGTGEEMSIIVANSLIHIFLLFL